MTNNKITAIWKYPTIVHIKCFWWEYLVWKNISVQNIEKMWKESAETVTLLNEI